MTWGPASDWEDEDGNPIRFIEHNPTTGEPGRSWVEPVVRETPKQKARFRGAGRLLLDPT